MMKEINIFGTDRLIPYSKTRIGSRAVVIQNGKLLVTREEACDYWMLPGGGLEIGETPEECCIREVSEETGYLIEPIEKFLVINEYYGEFHYICHCFICRMIGKGEQKLTKIEKMRGLVPKWVDIQFFADTVSEYQKYTFENREKSRAYLREHTTITQYINEQKETLYV